MNLDPYFSAYIQALVRHPEFFAHLERYSAGDSDTGVGGRVSEQSMAQLIPLMLSVGLCFLGSLSASRTFDSSPSHPSADQALTYPLFLFAHPQTCHG